MLEQKCERLKTESDMAYSHCMTAAQTQSVVDDDEIALRRNSGRSVSEGNQNISQRTRRYKPFLALTCNRFSLLQAVFYSRLASARAYSFLFGIFVFLVLNVHSTFGEDLNCVGTGSTNTWKLPFPQYSSVLGGSMVTVLGCGFEIGSMYVVDFSKPYSEYGSGHNFTIANVTESHKLYVVSPAMSSGEGPVLITITLQGGGLVPMDAASETFEYMSIVNRVTGLIPSMVYPPSDYASSRITQDEVVDCTNETGWVQCVSPVGGGAFLAVHGVGFLRSYGDQMFYNLQFSDPSSQRTVYSSPCLYVDSAYLSCPIPPWDYGPAVVSLKLWSKDVASVLQSYFTLFFASEISSVWPLVFNDKSIFEIVGGGFSSQNTYYCALWRSNSTGYSWLPEERLYIKATVKDSTHATCNISEVSMMSGWMPTVDFYDFFNHSLTRDVFFSHSHKEITGWGALYPNKAPINIGILVLRTNLTDRPVKGDLLYVDGEPFLPLWAGHNYSIPSVRHNFSRGSWYSVNVTQAPAFGGTPIELYTRGIHPGLAAKHNLSLSTLVNQSLHQLLPTAWNGNTSVPGLMFEVFAKRNSTLVALKLERVENIEEGISVRIASENFLGTGKEQSFDNFVWEPRECVYEEPSTCRFTSPYPVTAGLTYTILVVDTKGIKYFLQDQLQVLDSTCCASYTQNKMDCCANGCGGLRCENSSIFSDGFLTIRPGVIMSIYSFARNPQFVQVWGDQNSPRFFAGELVYDYEDYGDDYRCKFSLRSQDGSYLQSVSEYSKPSLVSSDLLSVAPKVVCKIPPWNKSASYPVCNGQSENNAWCTMDKINSNCAGTCKGGTYYPRKGTCDGECSCGYRGNISYPICNGGRGTCFCDAANTGQDCFENDDCTGGGTCESIGTCQILMALSLENQDLETIPYVPFDREQAFHFRIYPAWNEINVTEVLADGSASFEVGGYGFDQSSGLFLCRLTRIADSLVNLSLSAMALSPNRLVCHMSPLLVESTRSGNYTLSEQLVLEILWNNEVVPFVTPECGILLPSKFTSCTSPSLIVSEVWNSFSVPLNKPFSPTNISIFGFGFSPFEAQYFCKFTSSTWNQTNMAFVRSFNQIICELPSELNCNILVDVTLLRDASEIAFHGNQKTFCPQSSWHNLNSSQGEGFGEDMIMFNLNGIAQDCNTTYRCIFEILGQGTATSSMSESFAQCNNGACEVFCRTPNLYNHSLVGTFTPTVFRQGIVSRVIVHQTSQSCEGLCNFNETQDIDFIGPAGNDFYYFFTTWIEATPRASAEGGDILTVTGLGFLLQEAYRCKFVGQAGMQWSAIAEVTADSLFCEVPAWGVQYVSQHVNLSVYWVNRSCPADMAESETCMYEIKQKGKTSGFYQDFEFVPHWLSIHPQIVPWDQSYNVSVVGRGFAIEQEIQCVFDIPNVPSSPAIYINVTLILCQTPELRPAAVNQYNMRILSNATEILGIPSAPLNFIEFAVPKSVDFLNGYLVLGIPMYEGIDVTFEGAFPSSQSRVGLSLVASCNSGFVWESSLTTSVVAHVYNDFGGPDQLLYVCYSTDSSYVLQINVKVRSQPSATNSSITSIVPQRFGTMNATIFLYGARYSSLSFVAFVSTDTCNFQEHNYTLMLALDQALDVPTLLVALPLGVYQICYSTNGSDASSTWLLQSVQISVVDNTEILTSIFPPKVPARYEVNLTLPNNLFPPAPDLYILTLTLQGDSQTSVSFPIHESRVQMIVETGGLYDILIQTDGGTSEKALQANVAIEIFPPAGSTSIFSVSERIIILNQTAPLNFSGYFPSVFSVLAISNADCQPGTLAFSSNGNSSTLFDVFIPPANSPGIFAVCYSTSNGVSFERQGVSLTVIAQAKSDSMELVRPQIIPSLISFSLHIEPRNLFSSYSGLLFLHEDCNMDTSCSSRIFLNFYTNDLHVTLTIPGFWYLFYSTDSPSGPFLRQSLVRIEAIFQANFHSVLSIVPKRLSQDLSFTFTLQPVLAGATLHADNFTYLGFSSDVTCYDPEVQIQFDSPTLAFSIARDVNYTVCYSTLGSVPGAFLPQQGVYLYVFPRANESSLTQIYPDRIAIDNGVVFTFTGAIFSSFTHVAFTAENAPNCSEASHSEYLLQGSDGAVPYSEASFEPFATIGLYGICYSVSYIDASSQSFLQNSVNLRVIDQFRAGDITNVEVCYCDPSADVTACERGEANSICIQGQRDPLDGSHRLKLPAEIHYFFRFVGVDFSYNSRAAFSSHIHPWLGRPDCSEGRTVSQVLDKGHGNQSYAINSSIPRVGEFFPCISTHNGEEGTWLPRAQALPSDRYHVFLETFEKANEGSLSACQPTSWENGQAINMSCLGVVQSKFTVLKLADPHSCGQPDFADVGQFNDNGFSLVVPSWSGNINAQVTQRQLVLCYAFLGQDRFFEQSDLVFYSLRAAESLSIEEISLLRYGINSSEHQFLLFPLNLNISVELYGGQFNSKGNLAFCKTVAHARCHDCADLSFVVSPSPETYRQDYRAIFDTAKNYSLCYSTYKVNGDHVWIPQRFNVEVLPRARRDSIFTVRCIGYYCLTNSSFSAGRDIQLVFELASPSPFTRIAFTRNDCAHRVSESLIDSSNTITTQIMYPGTYYVCYTTSYTPEDFDGWAMQENLTLTVRPIWDLIVTPSQPIFSYQGGTISIFGTGFSQTDQYTCSIVFGPQQSTVLATVVTYSTLTCPVPTWYEAAVNTSLVVYWNSLPVTSSQGEVVKVFLIPRVRSSSPAYGDKLGGTVLTVFGNGFGGPMTWTKNTDCTEWKYRCRFHSIGSFDKTVEADSTSPQAVTCTSPLWSTSAWASYREDLEGTAKVELLSYCVGMENTTYTVNSVQDVIFVFRKVNKAPYFLGQNVILPENTTQYLIRNWTKVLYKGRTLDNSFAVDESDQKLTFVVNVLAPVFFKVSDRSDMCDVH
eukprot:752073-Hanusia_phi.AAC.4